MSSGTYYLLNLIKFDRGKTDQYVDTVSPIILPSRVARRFVFQTKNPNLGKFWRALEWKMLEYFMPIWINFTVIWYILLPFGNVVVIW
jgi:hypothetical protein